MIKKIFLLLVVGFGFLEIDACRPGCGLKGLQSYPQKYWDMKEALSKPVWGESPAGQPESSPEKLSVVIERYKSNPKWRHAIGTLLLDAIKGDDLGRVQVLLQSMSKKDWRKVDFLGHFLPCAVAMRQHSLEWSEENRFYKECDEPVRTTAVLQALLDFGISPNVRLCDGSTPQHAAVEQKDVTALQVLLVYGASLNMKNDQGKRPIDVGYYAVEDTERDKKITARNEQVLDTLFRNGSKMPRRSGEVRMVFAEQTAQELQLAKERRKHVRDVIRGPKKSACAIQ